jgi:23S rRNA pseudouridine1911/1915/1917 synthase
MDTIFDAARILHRDDRCVVINKKCGEAMEGAGEGVVDLPLELRATIGKSPASTAEDFYPTAVHRLDVPVTGCALFARTPEALSFLSDLFADEKAHKIYWAILEKNSAAEALAPSGELVHWISVDGKHNKSYAHPDPAPDRKKAILRYRVVGQGDRYVFVEIELITGRHHQIRAQLAALDLHIKGDLKYGSKRSEKDGGFRLHARLLAFPNPDGSSAFINVQAPVPVPDPLWTAFEGAAK